MRVAGALVSDGRAVAVQHVPAPPAGKAHQVGLATARVQPRARERVAELVRVQPVDTGLSTTAPEHLRDAKVMLTIVGGRVVYEREGAVRP